MANVELYTWTYCPFCKRAKHLLENKNIPYNEIVIDNYNKIKDDLKVRTGQSTVPYVFINDVFIGGCSELQSLDFSGKLDEMVKKS